MARGGARNRSGPQKDPNSARSMALGVEYVQLPAGGREGEAPEFPLTDVSERESQVWVELWKSPQAVAWEREQWRWMTVALYARLFVRVEDPDASAGLTSQLHRFADQIGLTPAGMRENGWVIAHDEVSTRREPASRGSARDRLKAVANDS